MKNNQKLSFDRRDFLITTVGGLLHTALSSSSLIKANPVGKFKAIAFDGFAVFDARPVFAMVNQLFPEKGKELTGTWRTKQFEYTWLREAADKYEDFWKLTEDALIFAARTSGVVLKPEDKTMLMNKYKSLEVWPDIVPALQTLKQHGLKLAFLSNMTVEMLKSSAGYAKIESYFDFFISTDEAKTYKPSRASYQLGVDKLKLKKEEILFTAFAGWDASGAKWFGYPTFWMNRQDAPVEELGVVVDGVGKNMSELLKFISI